MSIDYQNDRQSHCADVRSSTRDSNAESFASLVRSIIAGAQARGMADMQEMLEFGAILIAADGAVLYASDQAGA